MRRLANLRCRDRCVATQNRPRRAVCYFRTITRIAVPGHDRPVDHSAIRSSSNRAAGASATSLPSYHRGTPAPQAIVELPFEGGGTEGAEAERTHSGGRSFSNHCTISQRTVSLRHPG